MEMLFQFIIQVFLCFSAWMQKISPSPPQKSTLRTGDLAKWAGVNALHLDCPAFDPCHSIVSWAKLGTSSTTPSSVLSLEEPLRTIGCALIPKCSAGIDWNTFCHIDNPFFDHLGLLIFSDSEYWWITPCKFSYSGLFYLEYLTELSLFVNCHDSPETRMLRKNINPWPGLFSF